MEIQNHIFIFQVIFGWYHSTSCGPSWNQGLGAVMLFLLTGMERGSEVANDTWEQSFFGPIVFAGSKKMVTALKIHPSGCIRNMLTYS